VQLGPDDPHRGEHPKRGRDQQRAADCGVSVMHEAEISIMDCTRNMLALSIHIALAGRTEFLAVYLEMRNA